MQKTNINIIGAGAIGHLWTCFLNKKNTIAQLYARDQRKESQIEVTSPNESFYHTVHYKTLTQWKNSTFIIICVKAHQLDDLCQQLKKIRLNSTPIILMMNGMGLTEMVHRHLPNNPILHASITHGALLEKTKLQHTGKGITTLGSLLITYPKTLFQPLIKELNLALPEVQWNQYHQQSMNLKLIINSIINPITALYDLKNGQLLKNGVLITKANELLEEALPLINILLPTMSVEAVRQQIEAVALATKENSSSMREDVKQQRPTEIDFINGYLVQLANKNAINLSQHLQMIKAIKTL